MVQMLTEDQVVDAVCRDLEDRGYEIHSRATTKDHGIDITAAKGRRLLVIEAKGATSNLRSSNRFGRPFTRSQCRTHVVAAFITAAALVSDSAIQAGRRVAIALPSDRIHREFISKIATSLQRLGIGVIWVDARRQVTYDAPWQL